MERTAVGNALPILGTVGILGLFLPGIDKAWETHPDDVVGRKRIRTGEMAYLALAIILGSFAAYANGNSLPFVFAVGWALLVVWYHEMALHAEA